MQDELTALISADLGIKEFPLTEQQTLIAQFGEIALKAFLDREVPGHEELAKAAVAEEVKRFKEFQLAPSA